MYMEGALGDSHATTPMGAGSSAPQFWGFSRIYQYI